MVTQELKDLMKTIDNDALAGLDTATINAARAGGVLAMLFQEKLPLCDLCPPVLQSPAAFDAHKSHGVWANMCREHYRAEGSPELGLGRGQRLMLESAITDDTTPTRQQQPSMDELEEMMFDGDCTATDGCPVEPDGTCPHGCKSWLLEMGLI